MEHRVLVTGASSGIGAAIALQLNALGATIIANGRSMEKLEVIKAHAPYPDSFHNEPLDLTVDMKILPFWIKGLSARYGKLSGLAHAAGQALTASSLQYDLTAARALFDICCHAPLLLASAFSDRRHCTAQGGSLVFIAAAASVAPNKGQAIYGAAKAALVCAARCMSKELAPRGIRVNCISPGLVHTPMLEETTTLLGDIFMQEEEPLYPLGIGQPQDVAGLAAFLLSRAGRWITGQNYLIDGGRLA